MNLIEESFQTKQEKKKKKATTIILIAIIIVFIAIVAIISYLFYIQSTALKLTIDGVANEELKGLLDFETDGTIYMPIKEIAPYFNYQSFDGEYKGSTTEKSKCNVVGTSEVANFTLGSNKIYKLDLSNGGNGDYEYWYSKQPVKAINGVLYASTEMIEQAFNISFQYDTDHNRITIVTMPYLVQNYENRVLDYGYSQLDTTTLDNQKAVLQNILIAQKADTNGKYGVIDTQGNEILEPQYDKITYLPYTGDFLVQIDNRVGVVSAKREQKIPIIYSSISLMDSDAGLYIVRNERGKYGVIDFNGNMKIYTDNDQIGIDKSRFTENGITNSYLLIGNLIPAQKDNLWALYDKNGNMLVDYTYDSFGYVASSNRNVINLLIIPNYNILVVCKNQKYGLINSSGNLVLNTIADDIYMSEDSSGTHYYINANDKQYDAEEFLESQGVHTTTNSNNTNQNNENSATSGTEQQNNETQDENTDQQTSETSDENAGQQTSETSDENVDQQTSEIPDEDINQPSDQNM